MKNFTVPVGNEIFRCTNIAHYQINVLQFLILTSIINICSVFDFILHTAYTIDSCALTSIQLSLSLIDTIYCTADTNRRRRRFRASAWIFRLIWISLLHKVMKCVRNRHERFRCTFGSTYNRTARFRCVFGSTYCYRV
jgi:hypothetical protein